MAFNKELADRVRQCLGRRKNINERKMFGSVGFLLNGNMLVGIWKNSLVLRLGPEDGSDALKEAHVEEFDITGRPMKGWILVAADGVQTDSQLRNWIQRAIKFVANLPAK